MMMMVMMMMSSHVLVVAGPRRPAALVSRCHRLLWLLLLISALLVLPAQGGVQVGSQSVEAGLLRLPATSFLEAVALVTLGPVVPTLFVRLRSLESEAIPLGVSQLFTKETPHGGHLLGGGDVRLSLAVVSSGLSDGVQVPLTASPIQASGHRYLGGQVPGGVVQSSRHGGGLIRQCSFGQSGVPEAETELLDQLVVRLDISVWMSPSVQRTDTRMPLRERLPIGLGGGEEVRASLRSASRRDELGLIRV